jgi:hypothetical protein
MSRLKRLTQKYAEHIAVPWRKDTAAAQRVIFCIYDPYLELRLRASIGEFEIATRQSGHKWVSYDLTDSFAKWLSQQRYANNYFQKPHLLPTLLPKYLDYIVDQFTDFINAHEADENTVVAVCGIGSLFGLLKAKEVVDSLAPLVSGRLVVFFPGTYDENNNYRLLDGYDGWNYLAIPLTADN